MRVRNHQRVWVFEDVFGKETVIFYLALFLPMSMPLCAWPLYKLGYCKRTVPRLCTVRRCDRLFTVTKLGMVRKLTNLQYKYFET
jgi:hypothetical protein